MAWLRLPAIALVGAAEAATDGRGGFGFSVAVAVFAAWALGVLVWVHWRPIAPRFGLVTATVDIAAITALTFLSGGGFSQARVAYALVPITLAFRFRPFLTAAGALVGVAAYLAQAITHPSAAGGEAWRFIAVQAGYLLWIGAAAVLLAVVLARRTVRVAVLAERARDLLADALRAEDRERQALAESLHDSALQNLLAVRHDLQEAAEAAPVPALERAEATISDTVRQLREVVAELHPLVLEQAGLEAALSAVAALAARRGGFEVHLTFKGDEHHPHEQLILSAARELLTNVAKHARARRVEVRYAQAGGWVVLGVADDGVGTAGPVPEDRLAAGHIGLASQRVRIESAGGDLTVGGRPGGGTVATVRLPDVRAAV